MDSYLMTISPKGQITIPVAQRSKFKYSKCLLEVKNNIFILKPVEIKTVGGEDLANFSDLAESSFDFWKDPQDDVYQAYYADKTR